MFVKKCKKQKNKKWFCTTTDDVTTTTDDVRNLNQLYPEHMSTGGSAPRTPRPVSDDDTVDNISCRQFGLFLIFSNFEKTDLGRRNILVTGKNK